MNESKLIEILRCFTPKQIGHFKDFLQSPYHNKNNDLVVLFEYLKKHAPAFDHATALDRHVVLKKVFNNTKDVKKLSYYMSDLLQLAERFLVVEAVQTDAFHYFHLLDQYDNWNIEKAYNSTTRELRAMLEKSPLRDSKHYFNLYRLEMIESFSFGKGHIHTYNDHLQKALDCFDIYYLSLKLNNCCELMTQKDWVAGNYHFNMLDEVLTHLQQKDYSHVPCVAIYHKILLSIMHSEEEEHFHQLKALLEDYSDQFSPEEARNMFMYALNYTIRKINEGNTLYNRQAFEIYKTALPKKILFANGYLSPWTYKNIVTLGLRLEESKWIAEFIDSYKSFIEPNFRENAYTYNQAYLNFYRRQYGQTLQLLAKVEFSDIYYNLDAKVLIMKTYYELQEYEPFLSHVHAFKIFLKRSKLVSDYMQERYYQLIEFMRRLQKMHPSDTQGLVELEQEIATTPNVPDLNWLLNKIQQKKNR